MQKAIIRIGTRESQLAIWQATFVQQLLSKHSFKSELKFIKSDGDIDLVTPLYEIGVQGIFTKTLDAALLSDQIDIAVHSMKDVPIQLAKGIIQAAVLKRASCKDLLVYKNKLSIDKLLKASLEKEGIIATSSVRRKAQWLNRYPKHKIENLRGNVNTRLKKLNESNWDGAIFAVAGLERINLRPKNSIELDWMLPAPAQGAIMIACREQDMCSKQTCSFLNDDSTALCTKIERDFLRKLLGGCSTPISALAEIKNEIIHFKGNVCSPNGAEKIDIEKTISIKKAATLGIDAAEEMIQKGADKLIQALQHAK
jgi:hydroxymethylbilane synthase